MEQTSGEHAPGPADDVPEAEQHVSGMYTRALLGALGAVLPPDSLEEALGRTGETRSLEELAHFSTWSSHDQFKRILQEMVCSLNSTPSDLVSAMASVSHIDDEMGEIIQRFGSPRDVFLEGPGTTNPLLPTRRYETTEITANEWVIRERFTDGYAPYPEFCAFVAGQYSQIPMFFGLAAAVVIEEECQCRGDAACLFRVHWEENLDEATSRANYLEVHARVLEARLAQLRAMVTDLASNERYEDVLQGIVGSSVRAVGGVGAVLALEPRTGSSRKVYAEGLTTAEANALADDLLASDGRPGVVAVAVTSARRRYGVLAVDERGGIFASELEGTLETYAQLAAATLDAAEATEDSRHQAHSAQALLELSTSLAEIVSAEEMAARVVRAVPDVIDCDRVAIFLDEDAQGNGNGKFHLAAAHGYPPDAVALLGSQSYRERQAKAVSERGIDAGFESEVGTEANVSAPIVVGGNVIGCILAGVTSDPERLAVTPSLADRLKGLAAQASIAIGNARLVDQIRFQALHDPLTGLPNRALILDRTEQMLSRARRTNVPVAVLFIDLDGFKGVNDALGHGLGDQLLRMVTERLALTMRESDSIGRLGGDEFVVLVDGTTMDAGPELVAERLLAVLREPFQMDNTYGGSLSVTASVGIAIGIRESANELLRDADIALYRAKAAGKDCFVVFSSEMHTEIQDRLLLEMDLREALPAKQYFLVFQPILNLASGATTGLEALLRWRHPKRGVMQPDDFIPILEESNMITDVGRWVLQEACLQGQRWHSAGHRVEVSVNVSARQLESDQFVEDVRLALESSGFEPRSLTIEITETAIMKNRTAVVPRLAAIRDTGVRVAIDDFGTGYSSLSYLQQFPVDTLKIDRSFIAAMADSRESGALIHTLVQLGKSLGLETLAEGIEETDQYSQLEQEECDSGQGYLFARPLEAGAVKEFLANQPATRIKAAEVL
jgi:diguanylate cyclase (GGDEF)-like protein